MSRPQEIPLQLDGRLEASLTAVPDQHYEQVAVVCHPHPLHDGTMNNKVVTTLARTYRDRGVAVLRFNFRGVGASQGQWDDGVGEIDDCAAAVAMMLERYPGATIHLAGFSFGGYIAVQAALKHEVASLALVAPAASRFPLQGLQPSMPTWVAFNRDDDTVTPESMQSWVDSLNTQPALVVNETGGHFYHGQLGPLKRSFDTWLEGII